MGHGGEFWQNVVYWKRNGRPHQISCLENTINSLKRQKDRTLKDRLLRLVGAQYATGEQRRNDFRKNEELESKQKKQPVLDVTGDSSKVWYYKEQYRISSVQSLSRVWLFATPWIAAHQASLFIIISRSSLRLMSIESVMPSSHLILCHPILLLPPIPPSIKVFSNESTLPMRLCTIYFKMYLEITLHSNFYFTFQ